MDTLPVFHLLLVRYVYACNEIQHMASMTFFSGLVVLVHDATYILFVRVYSSAIRNHCMYYPEFAVCSLQLGDYCKEARLRALVWLVRT